MKDILGTREYPGRLRFDLYFVYIPVHRRAGDYTHPGPAHADPGKAQDRGDIYILGKIPYRLLGRSVKKDLVLFLTGEFEFFSHILHPFKSPGVLARRQDDFLYAGDTGGLQGVYPRNSAAGEINHRIVPGG